MSGRDLDYNDPSLSDQGDGQQLRTRVSARVFIAFFLSSLFSLEFVSLFSSLPLSFRRHSCLPVAVPPDALPLAHPLTRLMLLSRPTPPWAHSLVFFNAKSLQRTCAPFRAHRTNGSTTYEPRGSKRLPLVATTWDTASPGQTTLY